MSPEAEAALEAVTAMATQHRSRIRALSASFFSPMETPLSAVRPRRGVRFAPTDRCRVHTRDSEASHMHTPNPCSASSTHQLFTVIVINVVCPHGVWLH